MYSSLECIVCRYLISNFNMSCIKYQPFYTHAVYHTTVHSTYKLYIIVDAERNLWPLTHCGTNDGNKLYIYIIHLSILYSYYVVRLHNIAILEGIITIIITPHFKLSILNCRSMSQLKTCVTCPSTRNNVNPIF